MPAKVIHRVEYRIVCSERIFEVWIYGQDRCGRLLTPARHAGKSVGGITNQSEIIGNDVAFAYVPIQRKIRRQDHGRCDPERPEIPQQRRISIERRAA